MKEKGKGLLLIYLATMLFGLVAMVDIASAATPTIYVDPPVKIDNTLTPGKNFTISIKISNVTDMWAFEIKLRWGPTILDVYDNASTTDVVEGVTEGSFLKWGGSEPPQDTRLTANLDQTGGTLFIMGTLLDYDTSDPVSGDGTLVTIKFIVEETAATVLDLYGTVVMVIGPPPYDVIPTEHVSGDGFFSNVLSATYDKAVLNVVIPKTIVCVGFDLDINVTVQNQGNIREAFIVSAYYDSNVIGIGSIVTLSSGDSTNMTITWDTTGVAEPLTCACNYTISATASIAPDETDTADNTYINGVVTVTMIGDVKPDNIVNIKDIVTVAIAFGSKPGDPNWNPIADVNNDGKVNIKDIVIVAIHFGETGVC